MHSSRVLSAGMGILAQTLGHSIFAESNYRQANLCENGAINLIGSLLTSVYATELAQPLTAAGLQPSTRWKNPLFAKLIRRDWTRWG